MEMADSKVKQSRDDTSKGNEDDKSFLKEDVLNIFQGEDFENTFKPVIRRIVSTTVREAIATEMKSLDIKNLFDSNSTLVEALKTSVKNVKEQVSSEAHENTSDSFAEPAQLSSAEDDSDEKELTKWHNLADQEIDEARAEGYGKKHGTHAVLCIDTSGSMNEGDAWSHVKQFYNGFLDGMENLKEQDANHDNIALVTFGHETKVQQRLTKDLTCLRGKLDDVTPKGPSPLFGGLVMAAAAAQTSTFSFAMVNDLHVTPKIILVTDGRPTELNLLHGEDVADQTKLQKTKKTIFDEVEKLRREQIDLHCIYVGKDADRSFLRSLQSDHILELMSYRDGEKMALYTVLKCAREGDQRYVRYAGDAVKRRQPVPDVQDQLRTLMPMLPTNFTPDQSIPAKTPFTVDQLAACMGLLQMGLPMNENMPYRNRRTIQDNESQSDEDDDEYTGRKATTITLMGDQLINVYREIKDGKHPPIGTRVKRGNAWLWGSQDNYKAGTIIGHATDRSDSGQCWVHVEWDDDSKMKGKQNVYRYKMDDTMEEDVAKTGEDRVPPEGKVLAVGCKVKPGRGFLGDTKDKQGVVIRFHDNLAEVRWDDGSRDRYRYGSPESEIVPVMEPERTAKQNYYKRKRPYGRRDIPSVELTDITLQKIADTIGRDWQRLGDILGVDNAKLFHITEDNKDSAVMKILNMLKSWRSSVETPTLDVLVKAIKTSGAYYNNDRLQNIIQEIREEMPAKDQKHFE